MFSPAERDRIYACAVEQLRAMRPRIEQAAAPELPYDLIATQPHFEESVDILCGSMTYNRHAELNAIQLPPTFKVRA